MERHRHDLPDWLADTLKREVGDDFWPLAQSLDVPGTLDLRVNAFKARREDVVKDLKRHGVTAHPTPYSPWGLRVNGKPNLTRFEAYLRGISRSRTRARSFWRSWSMPIGVKWWWISVPAPAARHWRWVRPCAAPAACMRLTRRPTG